MCANSVDFRPELIGYVEDDEESTCEEIQAYMYVLCCFALLCFAFLCCAVLCCAVLCCTK